MILSVNEEYDKLVPLLSSEEYESLKESIKENGLWLPILCNSEGIILDGHHRFRACIELGIKTKQLTNHGSFLYTGEYKHDTIWVLSTKLDQKPAINPNFEIEKYKWFNAEQLLTLRSFVAKKCLGKRGE